jgi:hypothetical protein
MKTVAMQKQSTSARTYVALGIQHAMRMRQIVICSLSGSTIIFSHYLIKATI